MFVAPSVQVRKTAFVVATRTVRLRTELVV
jgi:hypothetical protein